MSSSSIILQLLVVAQKISLYGAYATFVAGLIGNTLNILVFTHLKIFRGNRCAFYLIVEGIASIILLCQAVIPEIFLVVYGIDLGNLSLFWCKIQTSLNQSCALLISSIVCFQAFDQYLSTHHRFDLRQWSTIGLARYLITLTFCLWLLQTIPFIIFYQIVPLSGCIITSQALMRYYAYFYYPVLNGLLPVFVSSLFSVLAYRNVRRLVRRQIPLERRRLDRQLTAMIFVRVIFFVTLLLPYTVYRIYILSANISSTDILRYEISRLIWVIVWMLLFGIYSVRLLLEFSFELFE
jgi:hypothetical protein